MRRSLLAKN